MKKAFSLVETIVATLILSIAIASLLKMKDNNLHILSNTLEKDNLDGYISIHTVSKENKDEHINFDNYINITDDDLRKELKDIKIDFKKELIDKKNLKLENMDLKFNIYQEKYIDKNKVNKIFYRITLDE